MNKTYKYISLIVSVFILIQNMSCVIYAENNNSDQIVFPQISSSYIKNEMSELIENKNHPYLIANDNSFKKVRELGFGRDEIVTKQYNLIKDKATFLIDEPLIKITTNVNEDSYISSAINFWNNIMALSFVYRVEGIEAYAQRAYEQALVFCNMSSWGTYQLIDNVQVAFGVSLCYDWLYDWLNNEQKQILINSLNEKHLNMMSDLYNNPNDDKYKWGFHQAVFSVSNHSVMDNTLTFLSAMAIYESNADFYADIMAHSLKSLENPLSTLYPDSTWHEGVGYWDFVGPYIARILVTLNNSFGNCWGYENIPCIMNLSDFPIYAQSSQGAFIWGDIYNYVHLMAPTIYSFGVLKGDVNLQKYALEHTGLDNTPDPVFCLMYDPLGDYDDDYQYRLDKFFNGTDIVTMRNTWSGNQQTWAAFAVQKKNGVNYHMMNSGTVGFDALGERWIMNHGREVYYKGYNDYSPTRWTWYRTRTESQSCIVINPSADGGQNLNSEDIIDTFVTTPGAAYAISDLTDTYEGQVNSYKRGVMLCNNRRTFVVQDELTMPEPSEVYSFFNIYKPTDIVICNDGRSAIVKKGNKKLHVKVDCDENFTFGVMDCEPLPTSPTPEYPNSPNTDYKKLYIHFDDVDKINIRVTFTPYLCDDELEFINNTSFIPIAQWCGEDNPLNLPVLNGIMLNGKSLDNFNKENRYYEVTDSELPSNLIALADEDKYDVSVNSKNNGMLYEIIVSDKYDSTNINTYLVVLTHQTKVTRPQTTWTASSYKGIMYPMEFYRIENNSNFSAMYFKDTAPARVTKALLTVYAQVNGFSVNSDLKLCVFNTENDFEYLTSSNSCISPSTTSAISSGAIGKYSVFGKNIQKLEYDITSIIPESGGDVLFALFSGTQDDDFIILASHRNSERSLRPKIKYVSKLSQE